MDLIRIGQYIAGKRKALGLTQKQLAEKLGVSDKSVSKWERGVCLPDVSLYTKLCAALGITTEEIIAFGDGQNDIGMLQLAGIGVAMGNALDEVKAAADYVTDTVEADGLAHALQYFHLI